MGLDDMWKGIMLKILVVFFGCKFMMVWFCFVNNLVWCVWLFKSRVNISNVVLYDLNIDVFYLFVYGVFEFFMKLINFSKYCFFVYIIIMD